jgi:hypothetical protein
MRIVVGTNTGQDPVPVADALREMGAREVQGPAPALPDVLIADFPDDDVDDWEHALETIMAVPGVRYAELDQMQTIFG